MVMLDHPDTNRHYLSWCQLHLYNIVYQKKITYLPKSVNSLLIRFKDMIYMILLDGFILIPDKKERLWILFGLDFKFSQCWTFLNVLYHSKMQDLNPTGLGRLCLIEKNVY